MFLRFLDLKDETTGKSDEKLTGDLMKIIIDLRQDAKNNKDWAASDKIRNELKRSGLLEGSERWGGLGK